MNEYSVKYDVASNYQTYQTKMAQGYQTSGMKLPEILTAPTVSLSP